MAFKIDLSHRAQLDIAEAVNHIAENSETHSARWFEDLFAALESLQEMPMRNPLIPEAAILRRQLRSFHHHSHRVVYEVQETKSKVFIVRVYHSARKPLDEKDLR